MPVQTLNTAERCSKGHEGEMVLYSHGYWKCRGCLRDYNALQRERRIAKGLNANGRPRSPKYGRTTEDRFFAKVEPTGFCWNWTAGLTEDGYGQFGLNRTGVLAHRWAYEFLVGPIPEGLVLDHLCRNRTCVNPDHLEPVTSVENVKRGYGINRYYRGRTACKSGHVYADTGFYLSKAGHRICRECVRLRGAKRVA